MNLLEFGKDVLKSINAKDIRVYDLKERSSFSDYAIIATALASRQLNALISKTYEMAEPLGIKVRNCVGRDSDWVIIDLYDVVIHFFTYEERLHFDMDKMLSKNEIV